MPADATHVKTKENVFLEGYSFIHVDAGQDIIEDIVKTVSIKY